MSKLNLSSIKSELHNMYQGYMFEIKPEFSTNSYNFTVYKKRKNISTINIPADTPINSFWDKITAWMRPILIYNHGKID